MAALNFPDTPVNGDKYVASNGVEYTYASANDTWTGATGETTSPANPTPADVSAVPPFDGGDGSKDNPFIITPSIVQTPGGTATSVQRITIINQPALSVGTWEVQSGPVAKYTQQPALFNSVGRWTDNLYYEDVPPTESGQSYTGLMVIGTAYFSWDVIQVANKTIFTPTAVPNASPKDVDYALDDKFGTVTGTYIDNPGVLTATGGVEFSINGAADVFAGTLAQGDTLSVSFNTDVVDATAEGTLIAGAITNNDGFLLTPTMVVDRSPSQFVIGNLENIETSSVVTSDNLLLSGFNARTYVSLGTGANTLTDIEASVGGREFADLPATVSYLSIIRPLQTGVITNAVITAGVGTTQPIYSNAPSNQTYYTNSGPDKAFNGLLTIPGLAGAAPEWDSFTMDLSSFNLKGDIKVQMLADEGSNTVGTWGYNNLPIMQHYGIDGVHNEYGDIYDLGVIELNSIQAGSANQMLAIYLNDQMLIDGGPALNTSSAVLTFADDTDLSLFTAEDAVRQDTNYTPVTSAITAVASTSSSVPTWSSVSTAQNMADIAGYADQLVLIGSIRPETVGVSTDGGATWSYPTTDLSTEQGWTCIAYGNGSYAALGPSNRWAYSTNGTTWTTPGTFTGDVNWNDIIYAEPAGVPTFVGCGATGSQTIRYSLNGGVTWNSAQQSSAIDQYYHIGLTYGEVAGTPRFVAISQWSTATSGASTMFSEDGQTWTDISDIVDSNWQDVAFGNGRYVAVARDGTTRFAYSDDGFNWVSLSTALDIYAWGRVEFGNGLFLATNNGGTGRTATSTDGINWVLGTTVSGLGDSYLRFINNKFWGNGSSAVFSTNVIVSGTLLTFTDTTNFANFRVGDVVDKGVLSVIDTPNKQMSVIPNNGDWTAATAAAANNWFSVTYGNGKYVAVSNNGTNQVMYSTDGISWTAASASEIAEWYSVTYGNGRFVAVAATGGSGAMYSSDGINWAAVTTPIDCSAVTYGGGKFVAVALSGTNQVMYSSDGINWTATTASADGWHSVTYGNGKFVAVSQAGRAMYSSDGISWNNGSNVDNSSWMNVTYGGGKFVAVASSGTNQVMYSADGINWTAATAADNNPWNSVTYGNGKFVAVATSGSNPVMYSTDGITWTTATAEASVWYSVIYGDGKFVAVAYSGTNQVMWSTTGTGADDLYVTTETVTGPLLTAPTGVFASADTSAKTMTLTSTDATGTTRWVVNGGRTVLGPDKDVPDPPGPAGNVFIDPGETMYIRGTTGSANDTNYYANIKIGNTTSDWVVKTVDGDPQIQQPAIVLPVNGADKTRSTD
jgi:hypothetical protein